MKETYNQHIGIYENFAPDHWCNNLIDIFNNTSFKEERNLTKNFELSVKDSTIYLENLDPTILKQLCLQYKNAHSRYLNQYSITKYDNFYIYGFKVQKTQKHEGFHTWHCENLSPPSINRTFVYTLYLNDVEEGGETEFLYQSYRLKPKKGTLCIFPASYTHLHRGNPPYSSSKYILTGWVNYIAFPPNHNLGTACPFPELQKYNKGLQYSEQILS